MWQETPLIYSDTLSKSLDASVYLKLEVLLRLLSVWLAQAKEILGPLIHAVIASGGNAGLAAACAAHDLGIKCTVYLPLGAAEATLRLLQHQNACVVVTGAYYSEALSAAKKTLEEDQYAVLVPAYDDPAIWEGHSSMVVEISKQLSAKPSAIFCSVGGGGLLGGLIVGCKRIGWDDVPLVAVETTGSDCFFHSMTLNQGRFNSVSKWLPRQADLVFDQTNDVYLAYLNGFSSQASGSLGASEPAAVVVKMALKRAGGTKCISVSDELSMQACLTFADDHKILVELGCSTTLVPAYNPSLFNRLIPRSESQSTQPLVVFIICGGFKVSVADLNSYRDQLENSLAKQWSVKYDDGHRDLIGELKHGF